MRDSATAEIADRQILRSLDVQYVVDLHPLHSNFYLPTFPLWPALICPPLPFLLPALSQMMHSPLCSPRAPLPRTASVVSAFRRKHIRHLALGYRHSSCFRLPLSATGAVYYAKLCKRWATRAGSSEGRCHPPAAMRSGASTHPLDSDLGSGDSHGILGKGSELVCYGPPFAVPKTCLAPGKKKE